MSDSSELEKIKEVVTAGNELEQSYKKILNIASSDTAGNLVRLVLYLFIGVGWVFVKRSLLKQQIQQARKLTEHEKLELRKFLREIQTGNADDMVTHMENGF